MMLEVPHTSLQEKILDYAGRNLEYGPDVYQFVVWDLMKYMPPHHQDFDIIAILLTKIMSKEDCSFTSAWAKLGIRDMNDVQRVAKRGRLEQETKWRKELETSSSQ